MHVNGLPQLYSPQLTKANLQGAAVQEGPLVMPEEKKIHTPTKYASARLCLVLCGGKIGIRSIHNQKLWYKRIIASWREVSRSVFFHASSDEF